MEGGDDLAWLVEKLVGSLTQSTHPNVKQAGCLWLLALTKVLMVVITYRVSGRTSYMYL